jgi:hypothetical protein
MLKVRLRETVPLSHLGTLAVKPEKFEKLRRSGIFNDTKFQRFFTEYALTDDIGQEAKKTRTFDGSRQFALFLMADCRYTGWNNLATLGNIALQ